MIAKENEALNCIHPVIFDGMCSECGKFCIPDSRYKKTKDIYVLSSMISNSKFEHFLHENKKLALIVDLDKTLIDTVRFINEQEAQSIIALDREHAAEYYYFKTNEPFFVRFRPYIQEFLKIISTYYFMQVYTLSERSYAMKIINKIDPDGKYFNNRILTREDSQHNKKSISDFFITGQNMTIVIDDTRNVWRNPDGSTISNLVQVKPFDFFPKIKNERKIRNRFEFIYLNVNKEEIKKNYLKGLATTLMQIHRKFYKFQQQNVSNIIKETKLSVFNGCYIYFCSIWAENNIEQKNMYIRDAKNNGAHVLKEFTPYTTHIVTTDPNHKDVIEAQKYKGIYILNYKWFINSMFSYEKQPEFNPMYIVHRHKYGSAPLVTEGTENKIDPPNNHDNEY